MQALSASLRSTCACMHACTHAYIHSLTHIYTMRSLPNEYAQSERSLKGAGSLKSSDELDSLLERRDVRDPAHKKREKEKIDTRRLRGRRTSGRGRLNHRARDRPTTDATAKRSLLFFGRALSSKKRAAGLTALSFSTCETASENHMQ